MNKEEANYSVFERRAVTFTLSALLALMVFLVFGQTLRHGFVNYDDDRYVYENPEVSKGLTVEGIGWAFRYGEIGHWHPLTWLSHMLDCQVYGLKPGGHHLTNVLLHAAAAILLFLALRRMTRALWSSVFIAAVFAIHPLRVESVAWISERKDVLSGLFFMLVLGAYAKYAERPEDQIRQGPDADSASRGASSRRFWYAMTIALFALGLMSKNMLVTVPFVLLLLDYWPLQRLQPSTLPRLILEKTPFFALSAASCFITNMVPETLAAANRMPFWLRAENAVVSYAAYLWQMIVPSGLSLPYLYPATLCFPLWQVCAGLVLLAAVTWAAVAWRKTHPYIIVGWFWYLGMLVPAIGFVQISYYARADRYTYLPQIGVYLAAAWGVSDLAIRWRVRPWLLAAAGAGIIAALVVGARIQTSFWRNSASLWAHTLACSPDNPVARLNYDASEGYQLGAQGHLAEAIERYERIVETAPSYADAKYIASVYFNLGMLFSRQNVPDKAIDHFRHAIELRPDYAEAHNNLGNVLAMRGRFDEAVTEYEQAIQINPDYADAHNDLADALAAKGRLSEAIQHYQTAIRIKPDYCGAYYNLGALFGLQGRLKDAAVYFQKAVDLQPNYAEAQGNLAKVLAAQGRLDEAILHYRKTLELMPGSVQGHYRLGEALDARGDFVGARTEFETTLRLDPRHAQAQTNLAWLLAACPEAPVRNGAKAAGLAAQVRERYKDPSPEVLGVLAAAYAESGQFDKAAEAERQAVGLAAAKNDRPLVQVLQSRLELYETGLPYHEAR
jgi:tetratricopeptide (TPR) repeat protein